MTAIAALMHRRFVTVGERFERRRFYTARAAIRYMNTALEEHGSRWAQVYVVAWPCGFTSRGVRRASHQ